MLELADLGLPIFLDLKLHDIPNTVAKAIHALREIEPAVLTVHAAGGRAMMEDAKAAAPAGTKVVGVTVLTSLDERDLKATGVRGDPHDQVERLADLSRAAGLDGIVCSGSEVKAAHAAWPKGFFVVPGVRLAERQSCRPEARHHPARGDGFGRVDPRHRPPDQRRRRSRRGAAGDRRDAVTSGQALPLGPTGAAMNM